MLIRSSRSGGLPGCPRTGVSGQIFAWLRGWARAGDAFEPGWIEMSTSIVFERVQADVLERLRPADTKRSRSPPSGQELQVSARALIVEIVLDKGRFRTFSDFWFCHARRGGRSLRFFFLDRRVLIWRYASGSRIAGECFRIYIRSDVRGADREFVRLAVHGAEPQSQRMAVLRVIFGILEDRETWEVGQFAYRRMNEQDAQLQRVSLVGIPSTSPWSAQSRFVSVALRGSVEEVERMLRESAVTDMNLLLSS